MSLENNLTNIDGMVCPSCKGILVSDIERGEKICSRCGIVIGAHFDVVNSENGSFFSTSTENENSKKSNSFIMYEIGLPTFIDKKNVDASGKTIHGSLEVEKLRRLNKFTISNDSKTRNLNKAMREILRITEILGMNQSIAERASYIYRKALSKKLIRGRSITGIVAATIYIACKDAEVHFPMEQIEDLIDNCNRKSVVHYCKVLLRCMKMTVGVPNPARYLSKISVRARLSGRTERRALEILSFLEGDPVLSGKKPISLAAASLYLAALQVGEHTTQLRIAIASDLTTITLRKRCLEIEQILKQREKKSTSASNIYPKEAISEPCKDGMPVEVIQIKI
jgi:transcription initiation factor TFIIB